MCQNKESEELIEKLLIQLLGHLSMEVRDMSIVLLNVLYDGVDWQFNEPLVPVISTVRRKFLIQKQVTIPGNPGLVMLTLNAPSFYLDSKLSPISWHSVKLKKVKKTQNIHKFP